MKPKHRRLSLLTASGVAVAMAAFLVLRALDSSLVFFYSPTMLVEQKPAPDKRIRIGGLVAEGSVKKADGATQFTIGDGKHQVQVRYRGVLPDLFREGQGVVCEGSLSGQGVFEAREVLAKHDENYMPPEVADALKKAGRWKENETRK